MDQFDKYVKASKKIPAEVLASLQSIEEPGRLCDTMAAHLTLPLKEKQALLSHHDIKERLEYLVALMESELDLLRSKSAFVVVSKSKWRKVSGNTI